MRWANENAFDAPIAAAAAAEGIPVALGKALIGQESQFNPQAVRPELLPPRAGTTARVADASRGLTQILDSTAEALGYTGTPDGLFDVPTNLTYGFRDLRQMLDQVDEGDLPSAISAYNGGYRPELGFGAPATKTLTICLARDPQGNCQQWHQVNPGEFANQAYVDAVLSNLAYFAAQLGTSTDQVQQQANANATGHSLLPVLVLVGLSLLALFLMRGL